VVSPTFFMQMCGSTSSKKKLIHIAVADLARTTEIID
jgi:hypothetical protein